MTLATTNYLTPTGREESWRFTPLARLGGLHDADVPLLSRSSLVADTLPAGVSMTEISAVNYVTKSQTEDQISRRVFESAESTDLSASQCCGARARVLAFGHSCGDTCSRNSRYLKLRTIDFGRGY